ncbi:MAG: helix-turn-helix transcriptional regulator, partial [Planctomycetes bacterium]|nr:helix-turn-helix transcriptional regulator [Planctomycetota bacterium]
MTSEQQAAMADRIRALLDARGASLSRLAKEAGVAKGYLWQMLRGEATNPGLDVVRKIAAAL